MSMAGLCLLVLLLIRCSPADSAGLRGQALSTQDVEATLLAELTGTSSASKDHMRSLEAALRPMYAAVPQETDGTLGHPVVRYVLHRFFMHQYGWFVRGLEPASSMKNETALGDLQGWVPSYLQKFIESLRGGRGLSLKELAALAATLEDLVHKEAVRRLEQAYHALEMPLNSSLDDAASRQMLEIFMMIYMLGGNFGLKGNASVHKAHTIFTEKLKYWSKLQEWIHNLQLGVSHRNSTGTLDFDTTSLVVEQIGRRYADFNKEECSTLKSTLLQGESQKAGRVRLAEFYRLGLAGVFDFNEKIDYLRTLGALDESDPAEPHVIVPNYVASRPNCLVVSSFYMVCCRNECEDLMGSLESYFAAEMVQPEKIIQFVSSMSSATTAAPRTLSTSLVSRLHSIAEGHGGSVPLHGRLFALWMHHAFPRECPYPHEAGRGSAQTPDEWIQENGEDESKHSREEVVAHVASDTCAFKPKGEEARAHHDRQENALPWDEMEELLQPAKVTSSARNAAKVQHRPVLRAIAPAAALASVAWAAVAFVWKRDRKSVV